MVQGLPEALSPKARYRLLRAGAGERVRALVAVTAATDVDDLTARVAALGGTAGSWSRETGLLTVELPAVQLGKLAELNGVVHVEADELYRQS
jgi:hypothetical protein